MGVMNIAQKLTTRLWDELDDSPLVMIGIPNQPQASEPMTVFFDRELADQLFIYLAEDNRLCEGLDAGHDEVAIQFAAKDHRFFASLSAKIERVDDDSYLDRFWSDEVGSWFDGRHDPKLTMIRCRLENAEMWTSDPSVKGKFERMLGGRAQPVETHRAAVALA